MTKNKLPKFKNLKEEADFWDTHDVTDYLDEMKFTNVKFISRQKKDDSITIRVEPVVKKQIEDISMTYGVNVSTLSRMWIMERLMQQQRQL